MERTESYVEINLSALRHNVRALKKGFGNHVQIMAVLKADAYGHGALPVFKTLISEGVERFAVANLSEALELRRENPHVEILVFGNISPDAFKIAGERHIGVTIFSREQWEVIKNTNPFPLSAYIKLNTGFNRLGFDYTPQAIETINEICNCGGVKIRGIYSHLALTSKEEDEKQLGRFWQMCEALKEKQLEFPLYSIADSISAVDYPSARLDMVRIGAALFGLRTDRVSYDAFGLKGVLKWYATISQIRHLEPGEGIGYDYTFIAPGPMKVGIVSAGYGDGYPRCLSNKGYVLVHGIKCPIIGLICMDQMAVDLTDVPQAQMYDKALLCESEAGSPVSAARLALMAETNKNEILASISKRVHRIYTEEMK